MHPHFINMETEAGKGFPAGSDSKESACNAEDLGSVPRLGRSPGGGKLGEVRSAHSHLPAKLEFRFQDPFDFRACF